MSYLDDVKSTFEQLLLGRPDPDMPNGMGAILVFAPFRRRIAEPDFKEMLCALPEPIAGLFWAVKVEIKPIDGRPHVFYSLAFRSTHYNLDVLYKIVIRNVCRTDTPHIEHVRHIIMRRNRWYGARKPIPLEKLVNDGYVNKHDQMIVKLILDTKAMLFGETLQMRLFNFQDPIPDETHQFTFKFDNLVPSKIPIYVDNRVLMRHSEFFRKLILEDNQNELQVPDTDDKLSREMHSTLLQYLHGCRAFSDEPPINYQFFWGSWNLAKRYRMDDALRVLGEQMERNRMYTVFEHFFERGVMAVASVENMPTFLMKLIKDKTIGDIRQLLLKVSIDELSGEVMKTIVRGIFEKVKEE